MKASDSLGNTIATCPDCDYWLCPLCGAHCLTVGRRSATNVGGRRGDQAPLLRCINCKYRAVVNWNVWSWSTPALEQS